MVICTADGIIQAVDPETIALDVGIIMSHVVCLLVSEKLGDVESVMCMCLCADAHSLRPRDDLNSRVLLVVRHMPSGFDEVRIERDKDSLVSRLIGRRSLDLISGLSE